MPAGRPTDYTVDLAAEICARLSDGENLKSICDSDEMPDRRTVYVWLGRHEEFNLMYARAKQDQANALFDDILSIADDARNDWMERQNEEGENLGWVVNGEALQRSRLRVDARKWMASKLLPKNYGDKVEIDQTTTHEVGNSVENLMERIANNGKRIHQG